jgi:cytoskeleton protein RodZ
MNESPQQSTDAEARGPLGGERLAVARRSHEISASDIAKELHLDEPKVRALEQNNFELLGAPVFAKGHLRKYAELVGVPIDDIIADYYQLNRTAGAPPVVGPARRFERNYSLGPWISGGVAIIIIASGAYWWLTREPARPVARTEPAILAPFSSEVTVDSESSQVNADPESSEVSDAAMRDEVTEPDDIALEAEPLIVVEESPAPDAAIASSAPPVFEADPLAEEVSLLPQVNVELYFSGDCWTEVTDASGRRLFYDLGTAGTVVALAGDEPLQIVLGDSENISIVVEGQDYPIADYVRRGSLTRLTISSQ